MSAKSGPVISSAICGTLGIFLGLGIGAQVSTKAAENFSVAGEARCSRLMFCFAPPEVALHSTEAFLQRVTIGSQDELLRRDRVFATTAVALLQQRLSLSKTDAAWVEAQEACRTVKYADCSKERLTRLLRNTCVNADKR